MLFRSANIYPRLYLWSEMFKLNHATRLASRLTAKFSSLHDKIKAVPSLNDFMKSTSDSDIKDNVEMQSNVLDGKRYYIETYGCQMNEADSEIVNSILQANGMSHTADAHESDLVLLNTCAIRENAESKVLQRLNELKAEKFKLKKDFMIGVLGCMAERMKVDLVEKNKAVDLVVGPDAYRDLPRLVSDLMVDLI